MPLKSTVALTALLALAVAVGSPARAAQAQASGADVSGSVNDFGFRLLRTLDGGAGENTIVSPLSVWLALAMTSNGAAGGTRTAIAKTIGVQPLDELDFNRAGHELLAALRKADPAVTMEIANALWTQSGFPINPDFLDTGRQFYDAASEGLDFQGQPDEAVAAVNAWVKTNTRGRIPTIISRVDRRTRLILTDAVYFKGIWSSPFDPKATRPRTFHAGARSLGAGSADGQRAPSSRTSKTTAFRRSGWPTATADSRCTSFFPAR